MATGRDRAAVVLPESIGYELTKQNLFLGSIEIIHIAITGSD
jgi:hypothetical protein